MHLVLLVDLQASEQKKAVPKAERLIDQMKLEETIRIRKKLTTFF